MEAGPGLSFGYTPNQSIVREVHLPLRAGRLTVLLGPNGSGKTTLLRLLLGQLNPEAGKVTIGGQPLSRLSPAQRARRIGYVPQRSGVSFGFTVREVVAMGRFAFNDTRWVEAGLRKLELQDLAHRPVRELSGGQQQRVMLARAWVQSRPADTSGSRGSTPSARLWGNVILADEPAANLDLRHVQHAMTMFREMAHEGLAVLVVLHDLTLAQRWADEVWLMDRGRLVAGGTPKQVLTPSCLEQVYGVPVQVIEHGSMRYFEVGRPLKTAGDTMTRGDNP